MAVKIKDVRTAVIGGPQSFASLAATEVFTVAAADRNSIEEEDVAFYNNSSHEQNPCKNVYHNSYENI
jgi:hypothetical protein